MTWLQYPPSGSSGGTDFTPQIEQLKTKDVEQDSLIVDISAKVDNTTAGSVILDQRITTLENKPAGTDYSPAIAAVQDKNTLQDTRLGAIDAALLSKAPLVDGKVPYDALPEFPVGRKVNVVNRAARLALPTYTDLTIAYESDTGDAYGLDANSDPAIDSNWSKLGNALGIGVASFNGRTGNIGPQTGDYITSMIPEAVDKRYVTPEQITAWDEKETTTGSQTKATAAQTAAVASSKAYADSTFILVSQKATASGVAPLNSSSKIPTTYLPTNIAGGVAGLDVVGRVPISNLPAFLPQSQRIWRDVKSSRPHLGYWLNSSGNEMVVRVRTGASTYTQRYIKANIQRADGTGTLSFNSYSDNSAGTRWIDMEIIVPNGYQYQFTTDGQTTAGGFETWYELS